MTLKASALTKFPTEVQECTFPVLSSDLGEKNIVPAYAGPCYPVLTKTTSVVLYLTMDRAI